MFNSLSYWLNLTLQFRKTLIQVPSTQVNFYSAINLSQKNTPIHFRVISEDKFAQQVQWYSITKIMLATPFSQIRWHLIFMEFIFKKKRKRSTECTQPFSDNFGCFLPWRFLTKVEKQHRNKKELKAKSV